MSFIEVRKRTKRSPTIAPSPERRMQIKQAVDDREDDMVISQRGGPLVAVRHILQLVQSIYSDGTIAGFNVVVPDEAMRGSEQS
ncbi:MAG TPA: hypothetical protein VFL68_06575 [Pseudolabrys sp.]|nr:hypothetical protein [Pseudolabrys sp.]